MGAPWSSGAWGLGPGPQWPRCWSATDDADFIIAKNTSEFSKRKRLDDMEWFTQWYIYVVCYYRPYLLVCVIWNEDKETSQGRPSKHCLLAYVACVAGRVASRTSDLQDVLSFVAVTASLRDSWVSFTIWSAQRSGGRPLGRCHVEGGVEARMSMAWVPGCRRQMCPKALRRSLRIVVVRGGCPVRMWIDAFVTKSCQRTPTMRRRAFVLKASRRFFCALVSVHEAEL